MTTHILIGYHLTTGMNKKLQEGMLLVSNYETFDGVSIFYC